MTYAGTFASASSAAVEAHFEIMLQSWTLYLLIAIIHAAAFGICAAGLQICFL